MVAPRGHFARPVPSVSLIRKVHRRFSASLDRECPVLHLILFLELIKYDSVNFKFTFYLVSYNMTSKQISLFFPPFPSKL